jgi:hypothetical protein
MWSSTKPGAPDAPPPTEPGGPDGATPAAPASAFTKPAPEGHAKKLSEVLGEVEPCRAGAAGLRPGSRCRSADEPVAAAHAAVHLRPRMARRVSGTVHTDDACAAAGQRLGRWCTGVL